MQRYLKVVFLVFLLAVFLLEGLGINNGRQVAYVLILLMPFFLFIPQFLSKEKQKVVFPQKLSFLFLTFFVLSAVSAAFGVNLQSSFENLVLYLCLFLVFIFVFNNKEILKSLIVPLVFILGFTFSTFSMFTSFFIKDNSLFLIPIDFSSQGYQFIYSAFGSHNHLGDFLLLPLTIISFMFFALKNKLNVFLLFLVFLPFFIFSYSRSAYLDLMLILIILSFYSFKEYRKKIKPLLVVFPALAFGILAVFLFVVPTDTKKLTLLNSFNVTLQQKYNLNGGKLSLAYRNKYATEGLFSISKNPLFGIGPGNFIYASAQYADSPGNNTVTSHNLFFDVFVENGVLAGMIFFLIFIEIIANIKKQLVKAKLDKLNKNNVLYIFLFLVMLFNFQTDYTYLIHSFFLLFFVLIGLIYQEQKTIAANRLVLLLSLALFVIFNLILVSNISFAKQDYKLALDTYPLNKNVYLSLVNEEIKNGNTNAALKYLNYYISLFKGDSDVLIYAGDVYYAYDRKKDALPYYEKAFEAYNFMDLGLITRIYNIKLNIQGRTQAKEFADKYFSKLSNANNTSSHSQTYYRYRIEALKVCKEIYGGNCGYSL